jgi:hypothetical protein
MEAILRMSQETCAYLDMSRGWRQWTDVAGARSWPPSPPAAASQGTQRYVEGATSFSVAYYCFCRPDLSFQGQHDRDMRKLPDLSALGVWRLSAYAGPLNLRECQIQACNPAYFPSTPHRLPAPVCVRLHSIQCCQLIRLFITCLCRSIEQRPDWGDSEADQPMALERNEHSSVLLLTNETNKSDRLCTAPCIQFTQ